MTNSYHKHCYNRLASFVLPPLLSQIHTHSPVAQAGRHISVVPAGLGTGTSAGAAESQPPVSSSSPPLPPSPSPPPADGCTPLVSMIHGERREVGGRWEGGERREEGGGRSMKRKRDRSEKRGPDRKKRDEEREERRRDEIER